MPKISIIFDCNIKSCQVDINFKAKISVPILDIAYTPFDNLCICVTLNPDATTSREIIGSIAEGVKADSSNPEAMARFKTIFSDPGLQMLSFTVTEPERWIAPTATTATVVIAEA